MIPINAVIQGPLLSPPTGNRKWPPNLDANCVPSIFCNSVAVRKLNGMVVVSTWDNESREQIDRLASDKSITALVETPDPGRPPDTNGRVSDNRLRQTLSTWKGLQELERQGAQGLVMKIRTDQTVPVEIVHNFAVDFLSGVDSSEWEKIVLIGSAHFRSLYEIDDFVFVGTIPAMRQFFEAQLSLAAFHSGTHSIHGDLVRKHLAGNIGPSLGWPEWRCFPALPPILSANVRPRIHVRLIDDWIRTLVDFLVPMPREVWHRTTWRGSPPFAEWYPAGPDRLWFEDRERLQRKGVELFLQKWPNTFSVCGSGSLSRPLDYALEVPHEIKLGRATCRTAAFRRARRIVNRVRFAQSFRTLNTGVAYQRQCEY